MKITQNQFRQIEILFPKKRGKLRISDLDALNAILYVAENGCKWRKLPKEFGPWHTIYTRMNRWAKKGVLDQIFTVLQEKNIIQIRVEAVSLDSTTIKVHPDGTGAQKKTDHRLLENPLEDGPQKFIWLPRMIGLQ